MEKSYIVISRVLDKRNSGSEIEHGFIIDNPQVGDSKTVSKYYHTDLSGAEWVFYPGTSCIQFEKPKSNSLTEDNFRSLIDCLKTKDDRVYLSALNRLVKYDIILTDEQKQMVVNLPVDRQAKTLCLNMLGTSNKEISELFAGKKKKSTPKGNLSFKNPTPSFNGELIGKDESGIEWINWKEVKGMEHVPAETIAEAKERVGFDNSYALARHNLSSEIRDLIEPNREKGISH